MGLGKGNQRRAGEEEMDTNMYPASQREQAGQHQGLGWRGEEGSLGGCRRPGKEALATQAKPDHRGPCWP